MSDLSQIVWFDGAGAFDPPTLGGKCRNLVALTRAGLPVPMGFAIPAETFIAFLHATGIYRQVEDGLGTSNSSVSEGAATNLVALISGADVPRALTHDIVDGYRELGRRLGILTPRVAVRSSATTEDLESASAAGQHSTLLDVAGEEDLIGAVRQCWASLFSYNAEVYRKQLGGNGGLAFPVMGVGVQAMVSAGVAGVMFTTDPVKEDADRIVVEATFGLGETLVSGQVTPDRYVIDKRTGRVVEQRIGEKAVELTRTASGLTHQPVPAERQAIPCLSHGDCARLLDLSLAVEAALGPNQDIEWAIDRADRCFILQTRPITADNRLDRLPTQEQRKKPSRGTLGGQMYRRWLKG